MMVPDHGMDYVNLKLYFCVQRRLMTEHGYIHLPGSHPVAITTHLLLSGSPQLVWNEALQGCLETAFQFLLGSIPTSRTSAMQVPVSQTQDHCLHRLCSTCSGASHFWPHHGLVLAQQALFTQQVLSGTCSIQHTCKAAWSRPDSDPSTLLCHLAFVHATSMIMVFNPLTLTYGSGKQQHHNFFSTACASVCGDILGSSCQCLFCNSSCCVLNDNAPEHAIR